MREPAGGSVFIFHLTTSYRVRIQCGILNTFPVAILRFEFCEARKYWRRVTDAQIVAEAVGSAFHAIGKKREQVRDQ